MIDAIQTGLKRAKTHWQVSVIVYAVNLVFALGFALAFKNVLADEFARRDVSSQLMEGFNFTFLSDMSYANASISSLLQTLNWFVVGYIIMSIFLSGGIITSLRREQFSLPDFFADSARYVGRFIVLAVLFAFTWLVPILAFIICSIIGSVQSKAAISEVPAVIWTTVGIGIALIKLAFFYLVFELAKFEVVTESMKPIQAFVSAFKIVFKNFPSLFGIVVVFLALIGAIGGILHVLAPKGETGAGVFVMALMQQALVVSRVFLRVATVGGLMSKYEDYRAILNEIKHTKELERLKQEEESAETKPLESEQVAAAQLPSHQTPTTHQVNDDEAVQKPKEPHL
ncbi:MAG: hypothetical protein ACUVRP_02035 [Chlorobiales bacterium]